MKLPRLSGREVIKILSKQGFKVSRQKGSHIILVKELKQSKKGYHFNYDTLEWTLIEDAYECSSYWGSIDIYEQLPGTNDISTYDPYSIMNNCRNYKVPEKLKAKFSCGDRRSMRFLYDEPTSYYSEFEKKHCSFDQCILEGGQDVGLLKRFNPITNTLGMTSIVCAAEY